MKTVRVSSCGVVQTGARSDAWIADQTDRCVGCSAETREDDGASQLCTGRDLERREIKVMRVTSAFERRDQSYWPVWREDPERLCLPMFRRRFGNSRPSCCQAHLPSDRVCRPPDLVCRPRDCVCRPAESARFIRTMNLPRRHTEENMPCLLANWPWGQPLDVRRGMISRHDRACEVTALTCADRTVGRDNICQSSSLTG